MILDRENIFIVGGGSVGLSFAVLLRREKKNNRVCKTALLGELILGKAQFAMNSKSNAHAG